MKNRVILLISVCLILFGESASSQGYKIDKIEIKPAALIAAAKDYIKEYREDIRYHGVVVLKCDLVNRVYYLTYVMYKNDIEQYPPSYFGLIDQKTILVYTGFEKHLNFQHGSFKDVFRAAGGALVVQPVEVTYNAPVWKVILDKDGYSKEDIESIPLDY